MFSYMTHCSTDTRAALFCFCSEISNLILEKYVQAKGAHPHRPRTAVGCFKRHVGEFVLSYQRIGNKRVDMCEWIEEERFLLMTTVILERPTI